MLTPTFLKLLLVLSAASASFADLKTDFPRYRYNTPMSHIHRRQNGSQNQTLGYFPVTGVLQRDLSNGSLPIRREIRELEKDQDLWTLYLLGLDYMQASEQDDPLSWYKIMGEVFWFCAKASSTAYLRNTRLT